MRPVSRISAATETAVAEREPGGCGLAARAAAADRGGVHLEAETRYDPCGGGLLELGGPLDRDSPYTGILEREPAENTCGSSSLLCLLESRVTQPRRVEEEGEQRTLRRVAREREGERREQLRIVLVDRRIDELPRVLDRQAAVAVGEAALDRGEPTADGAQRLDREPALLRPGAHRDPMPRRKRRIEPTRVVDAEVGEPRPDPGLVDDAVTEVPRRQHHMGLQRLLDDLGIGVCPGDPGQHTDVTALDEPEPPGAARDLGELPRQQVAPGFTVELGRLRE